jgi:subtilisin-like proprotein convertase family protein
MRTRYALLVALFAFGCAAADEAIPPEFEDLAPTFNKEDTAYYSDLATELQGVFHGEMALDLSAMSQAERDSYVQSLRSGGWKLTSLVTDHIKYGKNQLNTEKLHMNLSADNVTSHQVTLDGTTARVEYTLSIETIVSFEELRAAGIEPSSLTDRTFAVKLPADPRSVFTQVGERCAEGFDAGSLADYNYFYYFKPEKTGCDLTMITAAFTLHSLLPRKSTYPEYHRLIADRKVTAAVFFGAADHNETVSDSDEGVREYHEFLNTLRSRSFAKTQDLNPGQRWTRTKAGIEEIVDVVSPYELAELKNDTQGLFRKALLEHEIIIYDGHSFYGSLRVLQEKDAYPADTYQIIFMNSCWSYEYYTTQVFKNKATAADPTGFALADVVNNTEPAWFLNDAEETRILLTNIFAGCETGGRDGSRQYTWEGIIQAMNKFALERFKSWRLESHEVYGVSGVRENCYDPAHPDACLGQGGPTDPNTTERVSFENSAAQDIPDNQSGGIASSIQVTDDRAFTGLEVAVDIEHTWIGDLVVELRHNGKTVTLHSREGGSEKSIHKTYQPAGFAGQTSGGTWELLVSDRAARDTGRLLSWKLTFVTQKQAQAPQTYSSQDNLAIPDNDTAGIASTITVPDERTVGTLTVRVDITHSYVGDLVAELEHAGRVVTLQNQQGGSARNLVKDFTLADFNGASAKGSWTLLVSDRAAADSGTLNGWTLTVGD